MSPPTNTNNNYPTENVDVGDWETWKNKDEEVKFIYHHLAVPGHFNENSDQYNFLGSGHHSTSGFSNVEAEILT